VNNLTFVNALLYIIENGCKWRALPSEYGDWHTIYVRFNRWSKNGVIERIFVALQECGIISIETDIVCLDSTTAKVHPDGTGALKKSGEQSIGRSKGGSQPRFIWLPRLPNQH
jgi:transposase